MYLLDTDHISIFHRAGLEGQRIRARLAVIPPDEVSVSIVSYEEQMRGWLAHIARQPSFLRQLESYQQLERLLRYYCSTPLLLFDRRAVVELERLQALRLRIGTMDLKIAAIALANNATVLTRNLRDFGKILGLPIEDWTV